MKTIKLAKLGIGIHNVTGITGYLIDIHDVYNGYQLDGNQFGYNAKLTSIGAVSSAAGTELGAEAGAVIGGWFGGVGAIPGAIVGGAIGGIVGSVGGNYVGTSIFDMLYRK